MLLSLTLYRLNIIINDILHFIIQFLISWIFHTWYYLSDQVIYVKFIHYPFYSLQEIWTNWNRTQLCFFWIQKILTTEKFSLRKIWSENRWRTKKTGGPNFWARDFGWKFFIPKIFGCTIFVYQFFAVKFRIL